MTAKRISAAEYLEAHRSHAPTTVDLRTAAEADSECLEGCLSLPVQELNKETFEQLLEAAEHSDGPVHLLCQSGKRAEMAVEKLQGLTDRELIIIEGGLNAAKLAGANISRGERKVISLERQVRIAAGSLAVLGVVLGSLVHPANYAISAVVGAGLVFAGVTDTCGMALTLAKMPWNSGRKS
jgi:rhodanese-related sulfurtransferase